MSDVTKIAVSHESKRFSQHGEDGVLDTISTRLADRMPSSFIEFGAQPTESNTLALRHRGWNGVMIDQEGGAGILAAHVKRENVNDLISGHFGHQECGVFSIDLDGNDYWIVEAITAIRPAVIVLEYNAAFDAKVKLATPYREPREWTGGWDYSASLNAWVSMMWRKWEAKPCYIESSATNAFFVRESMARGRIDLSRSAEELMPVPQYSYGDPQSWEWVEVE